jgi:hypothetical protein
MPEVLIVTVYQVAQRNRRKQLMQADGAEHAITSKTQIMLVAACDFALSIEARNHFSLRLVALAKRQREVTQIRAPARNLSSPTVPEAG